MNDEAPALDEGEFVSRLADYHAALVAETTSADEGANQSARHENDSRILRAQESLRSLERLRLTSGAPSAFLKQGPEIANCKLGIADLQLAFCNLQFPGSDGAEALPPQHQSGPRFGRFIILEELGAGAHGVVYRALDPVLGREVALKVPRFETLASPELRGRFVREARALAALHHPHLLPVFEVGEVGPACYIASQLCRGPTLTARLRQRGEPGLVEPRQAAQLIGQLAETVQYVHAHGILHRDIKPANILLAPAVGCPRKVADVIDSQRNCKLQNAKCKFAIPNLQFAIFGAVFRLRLLGHRDAECEPFEFTPLLTDFGLAKWDDGQSAGTRTGAILGTPAYMAPEQAEGRTAEIGPATDVYGLGAVLYELLTGRPPFQDRNDLETLKRVTEGSLVAPRRLRAGIPRDLESVCLKCLEREPSQRYGSASEMADDLRRFVDGAPVRARHPGVVRHVCKWAQRKPLAAGLLLALLATGLTGVATVAWQWRQAAWNYRLAESHRAQAERNFRQSHEAVRELLAVSYVDDKYNSPEFHPLRKELLEAGLKYYRGFLNQRQDDPGLQAETAEVLHRIAMITISTGSKQHALDVFSESLPVWERLVETDPGNPEYAYFLAKTHRYCGFLLLTLGRREEALGSLQTAADMFGELCAAHPAKRGYLRELGHTHLDLQGCHQHAQRWDDSLAAAEAAMAAFERLTQLAPDAADDRRLLALSYEAMAQAHVATRRLEQALRSYEQARNMTEDLVERGLARPASESMLASIDRSLGSLFQQLGQPDKVLPCYEKALEINERLSEGYPSETKYRRELGTIQMHLGMWLSRSGDAVRARKHLEASFALREDLVRSGADAFTVRRDLGVLRLEIGKVQERACDVEAALANFQQAADLLTPWLAENPEDVNAHLQLSAAYAAIGTIHLTNSHLAEAADAFRQQVHHQTLAVDLRPDDAYQRVRLVEAHYSLGQQLQQLGDPDAAMSAYGQGLSQLLLVGDEPQLASRRALIRKQLFEAVNSTSARHAAKLR